MGNEDEFVSAGESFELVESNETGLAIPLSGVMKHRNKLVKNYHGGFASLSEKMKNDSASDLVTAIIQEIAKESDALLGNELIATENGELKDASVMSVKRADVLEKIIKAWQTKQQLEKDNGIDVESPSMIIVFKYFMNALRIIMDQLEYDGDEQNIFFSKLGNEMGNWKRDIKNQIDGVSGL